MTCSEYEPLIALYVEGDIEDRDLERHLAGCSDCCGVLEELRASQAWLKELGSEGVDAAFLSVLRAEVMARTQPRRAWAWIAACAAAVAGMVMVLPAPRKPVPVVEVVQAPVSIAAELPQAPAPVHKDRRRRRTQAGRPVVQVVKMFTEDPNIVVIWLPGD